MKGIWWYYGSYPHPKSWEKVRDMAGERAQAWIRKMHAVMKEETWRKVTRGEVSALMKEYEVIDRRARRERAARLAAGTDSSPSDE